MQMERVDLSHVKATIVATRNIFACISGFVACFHCLHVWTTCIVCVTCPIFYSGGCYICQNKKLHFPLIGDPETQIHGCKNRSF